MAANDISMLDFDIPSHVFGALTRVWDRAVQLRTVLLETPVFR